MATPIGPWIEAVALQDASHLHESPGPLLASLEDAAEAFAIFRHLGRKRDEANALNTLAVSLYSRGQWEDSIALLRASIALDRQLGDRFSLGKKLSNIGQLYAELGDVRRAEAFLERAVEVLGLTLPGAASIPAPDSRHAQMATLTGKRIVDMVWEDLKPLDILTKASFHNAVATVVGLGGSTNSIVHLVAMAKRSGIQLTIDEFDAIARNTPVLANLRPGGQYLMEDFYYAGGLRAFLAQMGDLIDGTQKTCVGTTLGENIAGAAVYNEDVIRPRSNPMLARDGLAVLRGNLAPGGAVIKPAAMESHLRKHQGKAVVFKDYNDMSARIDSPDLDVDRDSVIVLQSAGPQGAPGMPEWGQLPIPQKLLKEGVRDMLRISDARMSGTSYGACVLHVTPESHVGGPLALVQTGDVIAIDIDARSINMLVSDEELARRRAAWKPPIPKFTRGYGALYLKHIQQADQGCDFDFLEPGYGQTCDAAGGEPEIH